MSGEYCWLISPGMGFHMRPWTRVLYPDDSTASGRELRFIQEFFLAACSLADLIRRPRRGNTSWHDFPGKVAIQMNDTHPAFVVPELMRILLDEAHLGWNEAWGLTRETLAYTNHTLLHSSRDIVIDPDSMFDCQIKRIHAEVAASRGWYSPYWHYEHEPETRRALDSILSGEFSPDEPGIFEPLRAALLDGGDYYMHLADLRSYLKADADLVELYDDRRRWAERAMLNIAASGKFSSDRSVAEYAAEIWRAQPCPAP
jgi:glucan phosphorylase